jgi:hypothetical protein
VTLAPGLEDGCFTFPHGSLALAPTTGQAKGKDDCVLIL